MVGRNGAATTDFGTAPAQIGFDTGPEMTATYAYGVDGLRRSKTIDTTTTTTYTWSDSGGLPLLLSQQTGTARTSIIYGPDNQPVEQIDPTGTATWLHHDQLGSTRLTTNASTGAETARATYSAYGTPIASLTAGTQPLLGYASQYRDTETGYQYLRARYYDPTTANFLTRDPLQAVTAEPYGYTSNNPANGTDPTGLCGPFGNGGCPGGSLVPDAVSDAAGGLAREAWEHRDAIMSGAGLVVGVILITGTGGVATPFLLGGSLMLSGYQTYDECKDGMDADCAISAGATAVGFIGAGVGTANELLSDIPEVRIAMETAYGAKYAGSGPLANVNFALGALDLVANGYGLARGLWSCLG